MLIINNFTFLLQKILQKTILFCLKSVFFQVKIILKSVIFDREIYLKSVKCYATVISNERRMYCDGKVTYMPVYFVMFMGAATADAERSEYLF